MCSKQMMKLRRLKKLLKEPFVRIVLTLAFCFSFYAVLPESFLRGALTLSLILKGLLLFFIPFLIFSGTAMAFASLKNNGLWFIITMMGIIITSNFLNLMFSGVVACYLMPLLTHLDHQAPLAVSEAVINPYFYCNFPKIFPNAWALILGISSGILSAFFGMPKYMRFVQQVHRMTMGFMLRIFIPTLPLFLLGFVLKLLVEGQLSYFVMNNGKACLLMVGFLVLYLCIWLIAAKRCSRLSYGVLLKNVFPPIITGATTMSSAAALPFSIEAATKNTKDPVLANAVMPISINFHMVGDTICIPILAIIILTSFSCPMPTFGAYLFFGLCFVLNKFAGAGIPGGTIMVSLPILQNYLGFSEEMLALIAAFYMLIDPITTAGNVAANNFLVIFIKKAWGRITRRACKELQ